MVTELRPGSVEVALVSPAEGIAEHPIEPAITSDVVHLIFVLAPVALLIKRSVFVGVKGSVSDLSAGPEISVFFADEIYI